MQKRILALSIMTLALAACGDKVNHVNKATASAASGAVAPVAASAAAAGLDTESKQLSYIIGYQLASQMDLAQLKSINIELDKQVLFDAMQEQADGKPSKITPEAEHQVMMALSQKIEAAHVAAASAAAAEGQKFLADNKAKEGINTLPSGLQIKTNKEGTGAAIAQGDLASVEYEGRLTNGTVFDSTQNNDGKAFEVPVVEGTVIPGWIEALQNMKEGGEYTVYIPAELAYGAQSPTPKIPANSVLVFDMKVTKVQKGEGAKRMAKIRAEQEKMMKEAMKQQGK